MGLLAIILGILGGCSRGSEVAATQSTDAPSAYVVAALGDATRVRLVDMIGEAMGKPTTTNAGLHTTTFKVGNRVVRLIAAETMDLRVHANLAWTADAILLATDATYGPTPIVREHVLLARHMNASNVFIVFTNSELISDPELLDLEDIETHELLKKYRTDEAATGPMLDSVRAPKGRAKVVARGPEEIAKSFAAAAPRLALPPASKARRLDLSVYALTNVEGFSRTTARGLTDGRVSIIVRGQFATGQLKCPVPLRDGDSGEAQLLLDTEMEIGPASRLIILNDGHISAAAVATATSPR